MIMDFTVIICTYNRANNLPICLGELSRQLGVDDMDWEVLVVDNNSTDSTCETVAQTAKQLPVPVRYTFEAQQGLNYARNRGALESRGDYFCYVDDDIRVAPQWLAALFQALKTNDADAAGGRIHLDDSFVLPPWVKPEMYGFLGYQDFGELAFQMDGVSKYPFGGNMAFHRRVIDRIGLFNPLLGRKGSGLKRSELFKGAETDYFHRLAATGGRIFYAPAAIVYHQIQPFQLRKRYFRTLHYNAGVQKAYYDPRTYRRRLFGIPLFLFPQAARNVARYIGQLCTRGPDWSFRQQMTVGYFLGMMQGYLKRGQARSA
jgi:glycosyltransferase involved in cell wall biosynthesis